MGAVFLHLLTKMRRFGKVRPFPGVPNHQVNNQTEEAKVLRILTQ